MASIMQGTTPALCITIDAEDLLLSDVTAIELYVRNGDDTTTYTMSDLTIDTEENTITKEFTEEETAALNPRKPAVVQARFWTALGAVIGTEKLMFSVADMLEVGTDG